MQLLQFHSPEQIRAWAPAWDALWLASDVASPTAGAELTAQWLEHFAPTLPARCLAVEDRARLLAVLPLVQTRIKGCLAAGGVVANCWAACGQLLIDPAEPDEALDLLVSGLNQLPWPLLWLEGINPTTDGWRRFLAACTRAGFSHEFRYDRQVGLIDIDGNWTEFQNRWTRNHARNLQKAQRRALAAGGLQFHTFRVTDPAEASMLLDRAIQIEKRSWKARQHTSLDCHPQAEAYFHDQARVLAAGDALHIRFLTLSNRPIAYEYGYQAKGVYFAHKASYDAEYSSFSPGQLLMQETLRWHHSQGDVNVVDCLGPLTENLTRWVTRSYPEGRVLIASRRPSGRALWGAFRTARRWFSRAPQSMPLAADLSLPSMLPGQYC